MQSCSIVNHFINVFSDTNKNQEKFIIIDQLNKTNSLSPNDIDDLLSQKDRFWISMVVTIHKEFNDTHGWNRKHHTKRPKQ